MAKNRIFKNEREAACEVASLLLDGWRKIGSVNRSIVLRHSNGSCMRVSYEVC